MTTEKVYFVECAGRIKIGYSADVKRRMYDLATAAPLHLTLIATIDGSLQLERAVHRHLAAHRTNGEWFMDCEPVRSTIADLIERGPDAVGFVEDDESTKRTASPVQVAITNLIKTKRPPGTKAWELLSDRCALAERTAKKRLANASSYTIEEVRALIRCEDGHDFLKVVMADANPGWWKPLKKELKSARFRKLMESQPSA